MQFISLLLISAATWCCVLSQIVEKIIRNDFEGPNPDGTYRWALQTEGGIFHEQQGARNGDSLLVDGQYQYTSPDGQIIRVLYRADAAAGFHPQGAHLPTPPPIPPLIQRALAYLATTPSTRNS